MYRISAANDGSVWAVGYPGFIWKFSDGQGWVQQTSNTGVSLQDVDAVDSGTAWAAGDAGTILKTTDGEHNLAAAGVRHDREPSQDRRRQQQVRMGCWNRRCDTP